MRQRFPLAPSRSTLLWRGVLAGALALGSASALAGSGVGPAESAVQRLGPRPSSASVLVDFEDDLSDAEIAAQTAGLGIELIDTSGVAGGNRYRYVPTAGDRVDWTAFGDMVESVEVEQLMHIALHEEPGQAAPDTARPPNAPDDPLYQHQWHFDMVGAESAWALSRGEDVVVAVIDTGVSPGKLKSGKKSRLMRVPDLRDTAFVPGWNFVRRNADPSDGNGHGTHVAGTIAQSTHNGIGVAGLGYKAKVMPIKVLSDRGWGKTGDIANGIRFAADNGAHVINMSLGGGGYSSTMARAVKYAHDKGVTVVCAAGNGGREKVEYPAAYPGCVAVSSLGPDGKLAFYSSYGKELAIAAPGGDTRVDLNGDGIPDGVLQNTIVPGDPSRHGYFPFQGTSMATPHVAGVAAQVIAAGVTDPDAVREVLTGTAVDLHDPIRYGAGRLDAAAAVKKAARSQHMWALGVAGLLLALMARKRGIHALTVATAGAAAGGLFLLRGPLEFLGGGVLHVFSGSVLDVSSALFGPGTSMLWANAGLAWAPLLLLYGVKRARPVVAGLAVGLAGALLARGVLGTTDVLGVPGHGVLDAAWLLTNGAFAAVAARIAWPKRD